MRGKALAKRKNCSLFHPDGWLREQFPLPVYKCGGLLFGVRVEGDLTFFKANGHLPVGNIAGFLQGCFCIIATLSIENGDATVAVAAIIIDVVIGVTYGLISGYFGGKVDSVMQRIQEIINSIPTLVVLIILLMFMKPSLVTIIIALAFTEWIGMSRITRAQVLKVKEEEYVLASRTLGAKDFFIIFREILPNIYSQMIIMVMMSIPNAIFYEAYLSFIGLGLPIPEASLGTLINDGYKSFLVYPYIMLIPVAIFSLLMLCFNLFGDGLRDALDPTMKER